MTINEIYDWFLKKNYFKINNYNNTLYMFAENNLQLGYIEEYNNTSICFYKTGKFNDKEHNIIINDVGDLKILTKYFNNIFDRKYDGKYVVTGTKPYYINGEKFYKSQKLYKKYIPKYEKNLIK